jgi:hypothetical protein
MIFLIILMSMFYLTTLGYIGPKIGKWAYDRDGLDFRYKHNATTLATFVCILLPIAAPIVLGIWLSKHEFEKRDSRISRKQKREIMEAEHKKELARINAETIAIQEREAGIIS